MASNKGFVGILLEHSCICRGSDALRSSSHGYGQDGGRDSHLEMSLPSQPPLGQSPGMGYPPAEGVPLACEVEV